MGRPADVYNAYRRRLLPAFHSVLDVIIGGYALSDTPPEEYVGTLHCNESEVESWLESFGFTRNLVASLKVRVDGNVSNGSWVHRKSLLADHQLHVIIHQTEDGIDLYAHWEYSSIRHPYRHYLARDYSAETGVQMMRTILNDNADGISWEIQSSPRRHTWYISLLRAVSDSLARRFAEMPDRYDGGLRDERSGIIRRGISLLR